MKEASESVASVRLTVGAGAPEPQCTFKYMRIPSAAARPRIGVRGRLTARAQ